jgi:hypothetical protein
VTYTGTLLANTAVPAWHESARHDDARRVALSDFRQYWRRPAGMLEA